MAKSKICSIDGCDNHVCARGLCRKHYMRWYVHGDPLKLERTPNGVPASWLEKNKDFVGVECLPWPFANNGVGYGMASINGKFTLVHRFFCEYRHGPPPSPKHEAAHNCGNGHLGCANPQHLEWKTPTENQADRINHGTHARGEQNSRAKLTESEVIAIRSSTGVSGRCLARQYGVTDATIYDILNRRNWAWL